MHHHRGRKHLRNVDLNPSALDLTTGPTLKERPSLFRGLRGLRNPLVPTHQPYPSPHFPLLYRPIAPSSLETACSCHRALAQAVLFALSLPPPPPQCIHASLPHSLCVFRTHVTYSDGHFSNSTPANSTLFQSRFKRHLFREHKGPGTLPKALHFSFLAQLFSLMTAISK